MRHIDFQQPPGTCYKKHFSPLSSDFEWASTAVVLLWTHGSSPALLCLPEMRTISQLPGVGCHPKMIMLKLIPGFFCLFLVWN